MKAGTNITIQWDGQDIATVTSIEWDETWLIAYQGRMYAKTYKS